MNRPQHDPQHEARFRSLLEQYGDRLRWSVARLCPRHLGIRPEDIEQDVRLRLWRATVSEREIFNPASYVYRAVASATIDAMRRARNRREEPLPPEDMAAGEEDRPGPPPPAAAGPLPEGLAQQRQVLQKVEEALARFPTDRRRAIGLHLQGFTTSEIADFLGWTEPRARNLLHRGLKELRRRLHAEGIEYEAE